MPTPTNLDFSGLSHATTMTNQEAHLHLASPQSFSSTCKPFSTICSFQYGLSSSMVQSLVVKVQVSSTTTVSRHAFTSLAFEPVTSTTKVSRHAFTLLAFEPITSTTKVSCHAFALLAFELDTSITNISSAKTALKATAGMQLSANSNNINNTSSFDHKHSFTFQLVVASINWKSKAISNKLFRTLCLVGIKSKMPFIFQLIVGSKQVHQRILQQVLVNIWSPNAISYFGPNQHKSSCAYLLAVHSKCPNSHKSSCASLLAVCAKSLNSNKTHRMTPISALNFIGKSILEEARFAPTALQAFKLIVASTSIANFQLIVNLFLNPHCEGARADVASATICNKSIRLIDVLSSEGDSSVPANVGNTDSEGVRAPSTTFLTLHNRKSKYIVASHFSKTFLHFNEDFAIFCEGDWENVNNKNYSKEYEGQILNLPSLAKLALASLASSALLALVSLSFTLLELVHIYLVGLMDLISLVSLSG